MDSNPKYKNDSHFVCCKDCWCNDFLNVIYGCNDNNISNDVGETRSSAVCDRLNDSRTIQK